MGSVLQCNKEAHAKIVFNEMITVGLKMFLLYCYTALHTGVTILKML